MGKKSRRKWLRRAGELIAYAGDQKKQSEIVAKFGTHPKFRRAFNQLAEQARRPDSAMLRSREP